MPKVVFISDDVIQRSLDLGVGASVMQAAVAAMLIDYGNGSADLRPSFRLRITAMLDQLRIRTLASQR